jgi:hypothetical protein
MSRKTIALLALLFLAPIIVYFLWPSDETRIRKLFREGAHAVEAKKIEEVMEKVSFTYADSNGLNFFGLKEMLKGVFGRMNEIHADYTIRSLEIKEKKASVVLDIRATAIDSEGRAFLMGGEKEPFVVTFSLEKEHGRWLVAGTEGLPAFF